eukprot:TRINITY_DN2544_c0_g1_i1.p1 TRINITY_DN2544_c0_g1~~TRINITY_DN2544_c0_g1_i1.p1  ORF type:complete len:423 (+),score=78.91 TRINITY_DN2544_c0_g1_i1:385-1653(+)
MEHPKNQHERELKQMFDVIVQQQPGDAPPFSGELIYTYTDRDKWVDDATAAEPFTTSEEDSIHLLSLQESRAPSHAFPTPCVRMSIVAAVDAEPAPAGEWKGREQTLCTIRAYQDGRLEMKPAFSKDLTNPYQFTTPLGSMYEYTIENASEIQDVALMAADHATEMQLERRQAELRANLVGNVFDDAPKDHVAVFVQGEIVCGRAFDAANLMVEYTLQLPDGWRLISGPESGVTSLADSQNDYERAKIGPTVQRYTFAHPLEWRFAAAIGSIGRWPQVFFVCSSYDFWDRSVIHGYGHVTIPSTCAAHTEIVPTWRAVGSIRQEMASFLIGGSPQIADLAYTAVPSGSQGVVNKYGFVSRSSGNLTVRFNVITQQWGALRKQVLPSTTAASHRAMDVFVQLARQKARERVKARMSQLLKKDD